MAFKSQPTATSPPVLLGTPTSLLAAGGEQNQPPSHQHHGSAQHRAEAAGEAGDF